MFDFNKVTPESVEAEIRKNRTTNAAKKEVMQMLSEIMLASDMPETAKASLRIINASQDLESIVHDTATEAALRGDNINLDNAQKYILMLIACRNQIEAFLESNPLIANTEANNESV